MLIRLWQYCREHAQSQEERGAVAAQRDAAVLELETLREEVDGLRKTFEREQRQAQARVAAAEAEATELHAALATERQHAERAQQVRICFDTIARDRQTA